MIHEEAGCHISLQKISSNLSQHNITSSSAKYNFKSTLLINWSQLLYISFVRYAVRLT